MFLLCALCCWRNKGISRCFWHSHLMCKVVLALWLRPRAPEFPTVHIVCKEIRTTVTNSRCSLRGAEAAGQGPKLRACTARLDPLTLQWASISLLVVLFLYIVTWHSAAIRSCGHKGGSAGMRRVGFLFVCSLKCGSFPTVCFLKQTLELFSVSKVKSRCQQWQFKDLLYLNAFFNVLLFFCMFRMRKWF